MADAQIQPLAFTMGEPSGIGPELIARLWNERKAHEFAPFVYIGSKEAITSLAADMPIQSVKRPAEAKIVFDDALPLIEVGASTDTILGTPNQENGEAVIEALDKAVKYALDGDVAAIVTAPIHKAALYKAGFDAPGHTEYLARLCGMPDASSVMMLAAKDLRVVPVTVHIALSEVARQLTADKIIHAGLATAHDLKLRFGVKVPRLAMAALNPHAGEDGTMGMEEATHMMPAVWALRDAGIDVSDPLPADTLFHEDARKNYDAVLCMYHDQALIPVKTVDFWGGVNITLGLPIIRTSPDHGTALELAGKGLARSESMVAATKMAYQMALSQAVSS
ncbi:MAG: 4-hydroxythreonine-4-phosphate dehydrogenase PdxA [Kordiimonas sp.]